MSANLLVGFCLKIDGSLTFVCSELLTKMENWFKNTDVDSKNNNSFFFSSELSPESKLEASFLIFSILSHLIIKRTDIL